jgi:hypothetical protein
MQDFQRIGTEYIGLLVSDPLSIPVWWMLQMKFLFPAMMIARNDEMENFLKCFSLNGIKSFNICKPL